MTAVIDSVPVRRRSRDAVDVAVTDPRRQTSTNAGSTPADSEHDDGHRAGALQHGRAADPHLGGAGPGRPRPAVHGAARGVRPAGVPARSRSPTSRSRCGDGERMWTPKMEARVLQELRARAGRDRCWRSAPAAATSRRCSRRRGARGDQRRDRSRGWRPTATAQARARTASTTSTLAKSATARAASGRDDVRRDRADRLDAGAARRVPRAAEARRPRVRDRRRRAGDDRAPRALGRRPARASPTDLFETVIAPLRNAATPARFEF